MSCTKWIPGERPRPTVIECVSPIQSIAFGLGSGAVSAKQYWTRFDCSTPTCTLATGHANGRIRIWNTENGKLLLELMDHRGPVKALAYAPDGSLRLVSASADRTLKVWDLADDGNMTKTIHALGRDVQWCVWAPDAKVLASAGAGKIVYMWDMEKYELKQKLEGHLNDVISGVFSPDGAILATASWDTRVILWDAQTGNILQTLCHVFPPPRPIFAAGVNDSWVRSVAYNKTGDVIATIADDGLVRFWNLLGEEDPESIAMPSTAMVGCKFSPSGQSLAVAFLDCTVGFYAAPKQVPRLLHLARVAIRKRVGSLDVDKMDLPQVLKMYLGYQQRN